MPKYVTEQECERNRDACYELSSEKRGRINDEIKAMRREQRLGFTLVTIFIAVIGLLIRAGVI